MRQIGLALGVLLALTGCAGNPSGPASPGTSLAGTSWTITRIGETTPVAGSTPTMVFTADHASGITGCNYYSGEYSLTGSRLTVSSTTMTAMACAPALMEQESAFTAALGKVAGFTLAGETLSLTDASGATVLTLAAAVDPPQRPLVGTDWQLATIRTGATASSVVAGSSVELKIADGKLVGTACNTFRAKVTIDGASITVGPVASTRMACQPKEVGVQERKVLALLGAATSWKVTGLTLDLSTPNGDGLEFRAS